MKGELNCLQQMSRQQYEVEKNWEEVSKILDFYGKVLYMRKSYQ